eukprot:5117613-Amphidinium_carterae.1
MAQVSSFGGGGAEAGTLTKEMLKMCISVLGHSANVTVGALELQVLRCCDRGERWSRPGTWRLLLVHEPAQRENPQRGEANDWSGEAACNRLDQCGAHKKEVHVVPELRATESTLS